jgi:VIT1/CCC1 family predicted Fe2+/Mn2+ transporter
MPAVNENGRTLAGVVAELKSEAKDFAQTRLEMLKAEYRDKVKVWKTSVPLIVAAIMFLVTAWLVITGALVAILAAAFYPSRFAFFFAFLIVGVLYTIVGAICASMAIRNIKEQGIVPQRTMKVLQDDRVWLQTEARSQI